MRAVYDMAALGVNLAVFWLRQRLERNGPQLARPVLALSETVTVHRITVRQVAVLAPRIIPVAAAPFFDYRGG